jgi:hypothetical protein
MNVLDVGDGELFREKSYSFRWQRTEQCGFCPRLVINPSRSSLGMLILFLFHRKTGLFATHA